MEEIREYKKLVEKRKTVGHFGIDYLDKTLGGIHKGDLILIGAASGSGKTTLARKIAVENGKAGKRVLLCSLEDLDGDLEFKELFFTYKKVENDRGLSKGISFEDFRNNRYVDEKLIIEAYSRIGDKFKNITVKERKDTEYKIEDIKNFINEAVKGDFDLFILDHLDYVDKDTAREDDISHVTNLMKAIRGMQCATNMPIIAFSHLRKANIGKGKSIIPTMDDFIGSSNKVKQATQVIMFAPDDEKNTNELAENLKHTWCCIRKNRFGGWRNEAARLHFRTDMGFYLPTWDLVSTNYDGTKIIERKQNLGVNNDE